MILWFTEVQRSAASTAACRVSTIHSPLTAASIKSMAIWGVTASRTCLRPHPPSSPMEQQLATIKLLRVKTPAPKKSCSSYGKILRMLMTPLKKGRFAPKQASSCVFTGQVFPSVNVQKLAVNAVLGVCAMSSLLVIFLAVRLKNNTVQTLILTGISDSDMVHCLFTCILETTQQMTKNS